MKPRKRINSCTISQMFHLRFFVLPPCKPYKWHYIDVMSKKNLKYLWLILLSVVWLAGAFPSIDKSSTTDSVSYAEIATPTEVSFFDIKQNTTLYIYPASIFWLSLLIDNFFDNTDYQVIPRSEQNQFSTFFKIISYQHYIASLRTIFSIN